MEHEQSTEVSATALPKLRRESRAAITREKTARRKPWAPPSKLDAPPAPGRIQAPLASSRNDGI